jgi:hypothetical protein
MKQVEVYGVDEERDFITITVIKIKAMDITYDPRYNIAYIRCIDIHCQVKFNNLIKIKEG